MADDDRDLTSAALLGLAGGMRTFAPLTALSLHEMAGFGGPFRFIAVGAAGGELVADKHPDMPSRLAPRGFGLRLLFSGLGGFVLGGPRGALVGSAVAGTTAFALNRTRVALQSRTGRNAPWGAVEDALAIGLAAAATRGR
jgi:uncharacterized membrane protein